MALVQIVDHVPKLKAFISPDEKAAKPHDLAIIQFHCKHAETVSGFVLDATLKPSLGILEPVLPP
nr:hypothetical protein [Methylosinus sp. RM1]